MTFPWGAALSTGASIAAGFAGSSTSWKKRSKNLLNKQVRPALDANFDQQQKLVGQAKDAAVGGYTQGLAETTDIGANNSRRILERERSAMGSLQSDLTSRGLAGTTTRNYLQRGLRESTNRSLSEADARFAQLRSSLQVGRGNAEAAGLRSMAAQYGLRWNAEMGAIWSNMLGIKSGSGLPGLGSPGSSGGGGLDLSGLGNFIDGPLADFFKGSGSGGGAGLQLPGQ